jgi:uncharacterized protein YdhG (YjbR/CyaY superfamily)
MAKPTRVDEYCAGLANPAAQLIGQLRALAKDVAPRASEEIKWSYPAIVHPTGTILFMFSAHKNHASIAFTPSTREAFAADLTGYETGKGTVKLPYTEPVPIDLLRRMIEYRVTEVEQHGVTWM